MELPDESLVEHQEGETGVGNEGTGPSVVDSVEARPDLVDVISSAHSPLPDVIPEDVVGISELAGVALSLGGLSAFSAVDVGPVVDVDVIKALRGSESEVVMAWGGCLSETSNLGRQEASCLLR